MVKHFIPKNLSEALEYINSYNVTIVAGGTDVMVQKRSWANLPPRIEGHIMYIANLEQLNYIKTIDNHLHIGATTPLSDVLEYPDTPKILKEAIEIIATPALRNVGTIAGNIGNASPAGDTLPILYLEEALIVLESVNNRKILPISEVIIGPRKTIINTDEIITEIIIPTNKHTKSRFVKVGGRKADAISKVSFAGSVQIEENKITDLRICFGAVAPTVIRNKDIESQFIGMDLNDLRGNYQNIIDKYEPIIKPITDQRSNKNYRKKVALNLLKDFLKDI